MRRAVIIVLACGALSVLAWWIPVNAFTAVLSGGASAGMPVGEPTHQEEPLTP